MLLDTNDALFNAFIEAVSMIGVIVLVIFVILALVSLVTFIMKKSDERKEKKEKDMVIFPTFDDYADSEIINLKGPGPKVAEMLKTEHVKAEEIGSISYVDIYAIFNKKHKKYMVTVFPRNDMRHLSGMKNNPYTEFHTIGSEIKRIVYAFKSMEDTLMFVKNMSEMIENDGLNSNVNVEVIGDVRHLLNEKKNENKHKQNEYENIK